jgi:hypothetical protein
LGNTIDGSIFNKHNDQEKKTLVKRNLFNSNFSVLISSCNFDVTRIIQSLYYAPAGRYIPAKVPIEGAVLFKLGKYMQVLICLAYIPETVMNCDDDYVNKPEK